MHSMNKYSILLMTLFLTALAMSCKKQELPANENEVLIEYTDRYIIFDAGISTRGALNMKQYLDADFNVLGYQYPSEWDVTYSTLLPNVFDAVPQTVTYKAEGGYYSYEPIKKWTGNTYSFFGYYPIDNENILLFDDGITSKRGIPYITYSLPDSNDPRDLIDVMTGKYIDTGIYVSTDNTVQLEMRHRLSGIELCATNKFKSDHDSDTSTPEVDVTLEITDLTVTLSNVYTSAKIYMDNTTPTVGASEGSRSYKMVGADNWGKKQVELVPTNDQNPDLQYITTQDSKKETTLLLIPQTDKLRGTIELSYRKKYQGEYLGGVVTDKKDIVFDSSLTEGTVYELELYFTSEAVSVRVNNAYSWDELDKKVEHDFE